MNKKIILISLLIISTCSCDSFFKKSSQQNKIENIESSTMDNSGIIGSWSLSNLPKNVTSIDLIINSDGTLIMRGVVQSKLDMQEEKEFNCSWSKNGNNVYISKRGESEIMTMEILSLDSKSLVAHVKGEPEDEIMYFIKE